MIIRTAAAVLFQQIFMHSSFPVTRKVHSVQRPAVDRTQWMLCLKSFAPIFRSVAWHYSLLLVLELYAEKNFLLLNQHNKFSLSQECNNPCSNQISIRSILHSITQQSDPMPSILLPRQFRILQQQLYPGTPTVSHLLLASRRSFLTNSNLSSRPLPPSSLPPRTDSPHGGGLTSSSSKPVTKKTYEFVDPAYASSRRVNITNKFLTRTIDNLQYCLDHDAATRTSLEVRVTGRLTLWYYSLVVPDELVEAVRKHQAFWIHRMKKGITSHEEDMEVTILIDRTLNVLELFKKRWEKWYLGVWGSLLRMLP